MNGDDNGPGSVRTVRALLAEAGNDYSTATAELMEDFQARLLWSGPVTPRQAVGRPVSVIIAAHDAEATLPWVLDGLLAQTTPAAEVIVVDDASGDATAAVAEDHPAVTEVARLSRPHGLAAARNVGATLAGGDWLLYVGADSVPARDLVTEMAARTGDDRLALLGFYQPTPPPWEPGTCETSGTAGAWAGWTCPACSPPTWCACPSIGSLRPADGTSNSVLVRVAGIRHCWAPG